jgi:hypothetical protein
VFDQVHQLLFARLHVAGRIGWSRAAIGGSHIDAKGGACTGPSPVNRSRPGSKHHLLCDGDGTPIYVLTSTTFQDLRDYGRGWSLTQRG